eukprot:1159232-Pelagomonas_calceolata.AAC.18
MGERMCARQAQIRGSREGVPTRAAPFHHNQPYPCDVLGCPSAMVLQVKARTGQKSGEPV